MGRNLVEGIRRKSNTVGTELKQRSYPDSTAHYQNDKVYDASELYYSVSSV